MRIIRIRLKSEVTTLLSGISKEFGIDDVGFAEDVFSLMRTKGNGLPSQSRLSKMSHMIAKNSKVNQLGVNLLMSKRKSLLKRFIDLTYFKALCEEEDKVMGVRRLFTTFRTMYAKVRQAQCVSCHLKSQCQFGQQYGVVMSDITKVIDPNFENKVHPDCPHRPEIKMINQFDQSIQALNAIAEKSLAPFMTPANKAGAANMAAVAGLIEDALNDPEPSEDDEENDMDPEDVVDNYKPASMRKGSGKRNNRYSNAHTGAHICKVFEDFVKKVSSAQLAIFELGRKFSLKMDKSSKKNFKPVPNIDKDQNQEHIKSEAEISKLVSSQHGLPKQVFEARMQKKQLVKREYQRPDDRKRLLYLLIDSSASMDTQLGGSRHSLFTRASLATLFSLALIRKVKQESGIVYARFFEGGPSQRYSAVKVEEFNTLYDVINLNNYSGGSTNIMAALKIAVEDISQANAASELSRAEIMMITDCGDRLDPQNIKDLVGKTEFNVLDVAGSSSGPNAPLKASATKYFKAAEDAVDVDKLVALI